MHELPCPGAFLEEMKPLMKREARLFIAEPWFHVGRREFRKLRSLLDEAGFQIVAAPRLFWSRVLVLGKRKTAEKIKKV
jgi:hypothetical protein